MYIFFLLSFLLFLWQIHKNASFISESLSDYLIKFFFGLVSCIIPTGFALSELNAINQPIAWGVGVNILAFAEGFLFRKIIDNQQFSLKKSFSELKPRFIEFWKNQNLLNKFSFGILFFGVIFTTIFNLIISFVTVPNEWDSMTGHLVKCAFYLQNGNMNRIQGTTWTIDFYPNSLPTLQIFFYHLLDEKGFKIIHYLSYWAFVISIYGIAKCLSFTRSDGRLNPSPNGHSPNGEGLSKFPIGVLLISALLPTALVQATTTETDIVLTAYLGALVYFMFSFKNKANSLNISLIALMAGVFIGHKVTFLLISPALFVVAIYTILWKKEFYKKIILFITTFVVGILIFVLPTGYIGNIKEVGKFSMGSLSAPPLVMKWHGVEHLSTEEKIKNFALNIGRYSSDFLNFDGIRGTEIGKKANEVFRIIPNKIYDDFHLEGDRFTAVSGFSFEHPIRFYLERPYWGIISFGMILPIFIYLLFSFRKNNKEKLPYLVLMLAAILHFLSLCYSAVYDPIKARYFMNMAVWCLPLLAIKPFSGSIVGLKTYKIYDLFCSIIISLSAICTILFTRIHPVFAEKNIFNTTRMEQLTIGRPDITSAYQKFDEIVPKDAIVALGTQQEHEDFEYPLWGKDFKRKLIPIHPFRSAVKPIPAEAQYLFYSKGVIPFKEGDILLGEGDKNKDTAVEESMFFLRKLK